MCLKYIGINIEDKKFSGGILNMAENENGNGNGNGKKSTLFIIISIISVLTLGGVGSYYFFIMKGDNQKEKDKTKIADSETSEKEKKKESTGEEIVKDKSKEKEGSTTEGQESKKLVEKKELEHINFGETYKMKPFHINLGNPLENRFARIEISIEYKNGNLQKKEIEKRKPQLRDLIVDVASKKTREFLLAPDGKSQLRLEFLNRINQYMHYKIENVYITDILIE